MANIIINNPYTGRTQSAFSGGPNTRTAPTKFKGPGGATLVDESKPYSTDNPTTREAEQRATELRIAQERATIIEQKRKVEKQRQQTELLEQKKESNFDGLRADSAPLSRKRPLAQRKLVGSERFTEFKTEKKRETGLFAREQLSKRLIQPRITETSTGRDGLTGFTAEISQSQFIRSGQVSRLKPGLVTGQLIEEKGPVPIQQEEREGTYTAVPPPKGFIEKGFRKARQLETTSPFISGVAVSALGTLEFGKQVITDPVGTTVKTGVGLKDIGVRLFTGQGFPEIGRTLKTRTEFSAGFIAGELVQTRLLGTAIKQAGKGFEIGRTRLSPSFIPIEEGVLRVPSKAGTVDIKIAGGVASTAEPLTEQVKLAGQEVTAVSAQRGLFGDFFGRQITVEKPKLPGASELERSFFADPRGRLRTSRLGIETQKEATIVDILSGDVSFTKEKPQAIFFEQVKVQPFPTELKSIESKLARGQSLTVAEEAKLLKFQLNPSGEFKPIGFVGKESEITLAPGEIIRKTKQQGKTLISGRSVPLIQAEIVKSSPELKVLLGKETLTASQSSRAFNLLSQESGFSLSLEASLRPRLSPVSVFSPSLISLKLLRRYSPPSPSSPVISYRVSSKPVSSPISSLRPSRSPLSGPTSSPRGGSRAVSRAIGGGSYSPGSSPLSGPKSSPPSSPVGSSIARRPLLGPPPRPPPKIRIPQLEPPRKRKKKKFKRRKASRRFVYNPTITAKEFGLKGKKKKLEEELLTGFEDRPIPI